MKRRFHLPDLRDHVTARRRFIDDGLWGAWWHSGQVYAVWAGGCSYPIVAWRSGKWYCATDESVSRIVQALAPELDGEVHFVPLSELCQFIATGEPPVPPEVKALLSVCPE